MALLNENKLFTLLRFSGTPGEINKQWLQERQNGVGGSDVAAIMGLSPWKAPYTLWAEKTGRVKPEDISGKEAVAMGTELESDVVAMYKRRNPEARVQVVNAIAQSIKRPWARASVDGLTSDPKLGVGVLEIKTGGSEKAWEHGVPLYYQTQVQHYLSVTGYAFADVAALVGDHGLHYHQIRIMRDAEDIAAIDEAVDVFWLDCVKGDKVPLAVAADAKAVAEVGYPGTDELMPRVPRDLADRILMYEEAQEEAKAAKARADDLATGIKAALGQYKGCVTDTHKVTLSRFERTSIDSKRLKQEYPAIFAKCSKKSIGSRFTVKEID